MLKQNIYIVVDSITGGQSQTFATITAARRFAQRAMRRSGKLFYVKKVHSNPLTRRMNNNPWWPWKATRSARRRVRRVSPPESRRWGTGRKIMLTLSPARYEQWQREGICIDPRKRNPLTRDETALILKTARHDARQARMISHPYTKGLHRGRADRGMEITNTYGQLGSHTDPRGERTFRSERFWGMGRNPLTRRETAEVLREVRAYRQRARERSRGPGSIQARAYSLGVADGQARVAVRFGQARSGFHRGPGGRLVRVRQTSDNPLTRRETVQILRYAKASAKAARRLPETPSAREFHRGRAFGLGEVAYRFGQASERTSKILRYGIKRNPSRETGPLLFRSKAAATDYARSRGWNVNPRYVPLRVPQGKV